MRAQRAVKLALMPRGAGDTVWPDPLLNGPDAAMETNDLGFVASLLFVLVPAVFLIVLYIQTSSRQGG